MRTKKVRGTYHARLRATLVEATREPGCDQTSLAEALKRDQSGLSKYLRDEAGTMDLDEADKALRHCGLGGLLEFVTNTPPPRPHEDVPPRILTLVQQPEIMALLQDLLDVPPKRRAELLGIWQPTVKLLRGKRRGGRPPETSGGTNTTTPPKPRR
jgi:hypothetical protein